MNVFISASNRKNNCYKFLKEIKNEQDMLVSLADLNLEYCIGCSSCVNKLPNWCVIKDDMKILYEKMETADKIIIMSPIYMNHITGILKNVIDRLNPFSNHEILKGKKLYLITVGQLEENENEEIAESIKQYFEGLSEFFYFDFNYLGNLCSGEIDKVDSIPQYYGNSYQQLVEQMRLKIKGE